MVLANRGGRTPAGGEGLVPRSKGAGLTGEVSDDATPGGAPPTVARITVNLVAKVLADLRRTVARTHLSQTDVVNRALSLYEYVDSELSGGAELLLRKNGQDYVVKLL
jgi:hypothetical protein